MTANVRFIIGVLVGIMVVVFLVIVGFLFACEDDWCFVFPWQKVRATQSFGECEARGFPILESYPRQCKLPDGRTFTEEVEANIRVFEPDPNDDIGLPLLIQGEARVFENTFNYRLRDSDGSILIESYGMADAPDIGQFGPFLVTTNYPTPKGETGTVEVFEASAKDGSEINMVKIPVRYRDTESQMVQVFFGSEKLNPGAVDCSKVFPVDRRIPAAGGLMHRALEELLRGLTSTEMQGGYNTAINSGVGVQSVSHDFESKTVTADFSAMLEAGVAGSCRVTAIRAQIEETLKQFPDVEKVVISVNGRVEDVLQP